MSNNSLEKFNFFVPAEFSKSDLEESSEMIIAGIASSSSAIDSDGETLCPDGFDFTPFLTKGLLNWDHQSKKTASAIIGEPTVAKVINDGKDFYIEGFLYSDSQEARNVYNLGKILEKNSKTRRLGFSIEGQVIERGCGPEFLDREKKVRNSSYDPELWKRVTKARITGCAITPCPKNPNTLLQIVKGEYSDLMMSEDYDEEVVKAMEVNQDLTQHDPSSEISKLKKKKKKKVDQQEDEVGSLLKKSEIYDLILHTFDVDIEKAKEIYSLIENVNEKIFKMSKTQISKEAISKAFNLLKSESDELELLKANSSPFDDNDDDDDDDLAAEDVKKADDAPEEDEEQEDDEFESAKKDAKGLMDKNLTKGQMIDELIKSGHDIIVAAAACDACIREASQNKDGGKIQTLGKSDSFEPEDLHTEVLRKALDESNDLLKSLNESVDKKFHSIGVILQGATQTIERQSRQVEELTKSNQELSERVGRYEQTPNPRKSLVNVSAVERFEKGSSEDNFGGADVYDLSKSEDVRGLVDRLDAEADLLRTKGDRVQVAKLERAISGLEITKGLQPDLIPFLKARNIAVKRSNG